MISLTDYICECGNPVLIRTGRPPKQCHVCAHHKLPEPTPEDVRIVALWISEHRYKHCVPVSNTQTCRDARDLIEAA